MVLLYGCALVWVAKLLYNKITMTKLNKNECGILINVLNSGKYGVQEFQTVAELINKLVTIGNEVEPVVEVAEIPSV